MSSPARLLVDNTSSYVYAPPMTEGYDWRGWLHRRGISDESIERFVLRYDEAQHSIMIPYFDASGNISQVRRRRLGEGHPKYIGEKGQEAMLYNVVDAAASPVFVTEGEFDAVILAQLGHNAVAVPGTQTFKPAWKWLFMDAEVRIAFDGDDAGRKGAFKLAQVLNHVAADVQIIEIPEGEDITSLHLLGQLGEVIAA